MRTFISFFIAVLFLLSVSCRKEQLITDDTFRLRFSTDTLTFDTVFTSLGSATRSLKFYNDKVGKVIISSISIAGGNASSFRMNVDGIPGNQVEEVELLGKDSLYIFVDVTVDPNQANLPFIITDSIIFTTNGVRQSIVLAAWGQNAYFYNGSGETGILQTQTWTNDKPHVIFNSAQVDTGQTLTIEAGTTVYLDPASSLFVSGRLIVNGTKDNPVVFRHIRLEEFYEDLPGQWGGIFLLRSSLPHTITFAEVLNSEFGVSVGDAQLDPDLAGCDFPSVFVGGNAPELNISNTTIHNCLSNGISGTLSVINATNCLVYECGQHMVSLLLGGNYTFNHCTFATYGTSTLSHQEAGVRLNNGLIVGCNGIETLYPAQLNAVFSNCIVYGSLENEILRDSVPDQPDLFKYKFDHALVKSNIDIEDTSHFIAVIQNQDPLFSDRAKGDYSLLLSSPAINSGKALSPPINNDILLNPRADGSPDIGCFEFQ